MRSVKALNASYSSSRCNHVPTAESNANSSYIRSCNRTTSRREVEAKRERRVTKADSAELQTQ
jgi:hypothetical protein